MTKLDRIILVSLTIGVWALVAQQLVRPAVATTQLAEMPLQSVFNQYLTTALTQARTVANSCRIKGVMHGTELDAQVMC